MQEAGDSFALAGIRLRHPRADEREQHLREAVWHGASTAPDPAPG
jgi:hypothetical protein